MKGLREMYESVRFVETKGISVFQSLVFIHLTL